MKAPDPKHFLRIRSFFLSVFFPASAVAATVASAAFNVTGYLNVFPNGNTGGTVWANGFHQHSSKLYKTDIEAIDPRGASDEGVGLGAIQKIKVSKFRYLSHPQLSEITVKNRKDCIKLPERVIGAIAEENEHILSENETGVGVDLTQIIWNSVLAIQELAEENRKLKKRLEAA